MKIAARIIICSALLITLFNHTPNKQVAAAATYDTIWASSGPYDWKPGESRQIKVTGVYSDGRKVDLTSGSTGTTYQILVLERSENNDPPLVTISSNGIISLSKDLADGVTAQILIKNGDKTAQTNLRVNVPVNFKDITSSYAKAAIIKLTKTRAINGFNDGTFRPANLVSREQFITMLAASGGGFSIHPPVVTGTHTYADNQDSHAWYFPWIHEKGYFFQPIKKTDSIDDSIFGVGLPTTRQDAIYAIMNKYFPAAEQIIKNQNPNHVFDEKTFQNFGDINQVKQINQIAVTAAKFLCITAGYPDGNFHPDEPITREMAAQLINIAVVEYYNDIKSEYHLFGY
jgi:hypothetical protein